MLALTPTRRIWGDVWIDARARTIARGGAVARFSPNRFVTAAGLVAAAPHLVARAALIEALWGDDAEGGPLLADKAIDQHIHFARRALAPLGIRIACVHAIGWSAWFDERAARLAA